MVIVVIIIVVVVVVVVFVVIVVVFVSVVVFVVGVVVVVISIAVISLVAGVQHSLLAPSSPNGPWPAGTPKVGHKQKLLKNMWDGTKTGLVVSMVQLLFVRGRNPKTGSISR